MTNAIRIAQYSGHEFPAGTYYVVENGYNDTMHTLLMREDDDRRGRAWNVGRDATARVREAVESAGLDGATHYGWHVPRGVVEFLAENASTFGALSIGEAFSIPADNGTSLSRTWVKTGDGEARQVLGNNDYNGRMSFFGNDNDVTVVTLSVVVPGEELLSPAAVGERVRDAVREERARLTREFDQWKENATEIAHQYANDNSLCGEFDRCMSEIGLRPRDREWQVTFSVTVNVEASDDDSAVEQAREEYPDLLRWADVEDVEAA